MKQNYLFGICNLKVDKLPIEINSNLVLREVTDEELSVMSSLVSSDWANSQIPLPKIVFDCALEIDYGDKVPDLFESIGQNMKNRMDRYSFILDTFFKDSFSPKPFIGWSAALQDSEMRSFWTNRQFSFLASEKCYTLKESNIKKFTEHSKLIINSTKLSYIFIAIERYMKSQHDRLEEKVIDHTIALEALVGDSSGPSTGSISYKIALRTAFLVGKNAFDREKIFTFIKKIYGLRSTLVHGQKPSKKSIEELEKLTGKKYYWPFLSEVLLAAITNAIKLNKKNLAQYIDECLLESKKL